MRYKNLVTKEPININELDLIKHNIAFMFNMAQEPCYMGTETDINWLITQANPIIIRESVVILNAVNLTTFTYNKKIYKGRWNKRINPKNNKILYVFCTSEQGNYEGDRIPYIGFKRHAYIVDYGYSEIEFIVNDTCPFYKEIQRKIKI